MKYLYDTNKTLIAIANTESDSDMMCKDFDKKIETKIFDNIIRAYLSHNFKGARKPLSEWNRYIIESESDRFIFEKFDTDKYSLVSQSNQIDSSKERT